MTYSDGGRTAPVSPSTLSYKDRMTLRQDSGYAYATLYSNDITARPVWGRLHADASVRQTRRLTPTKPQTLFCPVGQMPGDLIKAKTVNLPSSGYITNTRRVCWNPDMPLRTSHLSYENEVPVESLHPMIERRFKKTNPLEYNCAIRTHTETTSQAMRMLGTYESDFPHAERLKVHIPHQCPGGPTRGTLFHPDVKTSRSADFVSRTAARDMFY